MKPRPVYVYLVPKARWPKKVTTAEQSDRVYADYDGVTGKLLGYEFLNAWEVEVDGHKK